MSATQHATPYAWVITKDHIDGEEEGVHGPFGCSLSPDEIKKHPKREFFKMYDDDGVLYYDGYFVQLDEDADCDEVSGFEPLDDFGMPNAGAVCIKYRNKKTGKMEVL